MQTKNLIKLLASILKAEELSPWHKDLIKEMLNHPSKEQLDDIIKTGKIP